jgi:hypothetical protein
METLIVTLRRKVDVRPNHHDTVIHWVAEIETPRIRVTGRSIEVVDRAIRRSLAFEPAWDVARVHAARFRYVLADAPDALNAAIAARAREIDLARELAERIDRATDDVGEQLLSEPPELSIRDVAHVLGVSKARVQDIAVQCEGMTSREARKRARAEQLVREELDRIERVREIRRARARAAASRAPEKIDYDYDDYE